MMFWRKSPAPAKKIDTTPEKANANNKSKKSLKQLKPNIPKESPYRIGKITTPPKKPTEAAVPKTAPESPSIAEAPTSVRKFVDTPIPRSPVEKQNDSIIVRADTKAHADAKPCHIDDVHSSSDARETRDPLLEHPTTRRVEAALAAAGADLDLDDVHIIEHHDIKNLMGPNLQQHPTIQAIQRNADPDKERPIFVLMMDKKVRQKELRKLAKMREDDSEKKKEKKKKNKKKSKRSKRSKRSSRKSKRKAKRDASSPSSSDSSDSDSSKKKKKAKHAKKSSDVQPVQPPPPPPPAPAPPPPPVQIQPIYLAPPPPTPIIVNIMQNDDETSGASAVSGTPEVVQVQPKAPRAPNPRPPAKQDPNKVVVYLPKDGKKK